MSSTATNPVWRQRHSQRFTYVYVIKAKNVDETCLVRYMNVVARFHFPQFSRIYSPQQFLRLILISNFYLLKSLYVKFELKCKVI